MYTRFKNSILNPKMIHQYTDSKLKTFGYFVFLLLIFTLPNILYICFTGGIDNNVFVEMANAYSKQESSMFIADYKLYSLMPDEKLYVETDTCGMYFFPYLEDSNRDFISKEMESFDNEAKQYELIFTKNNISGIYQVNNARFFVELATYEEIGVLSAKLSLDSRVVVGNEFAGVLFGLFNKYKTMIIAISIPTILINGIIGLLFMILIPTLILYLFNRHLGIKYGKIYHMGIYAFTIYTFANTLSIFMASSLLLIVCQLISFFYLSTAVRYYFISTNGGNKHGL